MLLIDRGAHSSALHACPALDGPGKLKNAGTSESGSWKCIFQIVSNCTVDTVQSWVRVTSIHKFPVFPEEEEVLASFAGRPSDTLMEEARNISRQVGLHWMAESMRDAVASATVKSSTPTPMSERVVGVHVRKKVKLLEPKKTTTTTSSTATTSTGSGTGSGTGSQNATDSLVAGQQQHGKIEEDKRDFVWTAGDLLFVLQQVGQVTFFPHI